MPPCALHDTIFLVCDMTTLLAYFFFKWTLFPKNKTSRRQLWRNAIFFHCLCLLHKYVPFLFQPTIVFFRSPFILLENSAVILNTIIKKIPMEFSGKIMFIKKLKYLLDRVDMREHCTHIKRTYGKLKNILQLVPNVCIAYKSRLSSWYNTCSYSSKS